MRSCQVISGHVRLCQVVSFWMSGRSHQEMDSQADSEYLQKRAQETIDEFLAGNNIKDKEAAKRQLKLTSEELIQLKCLEWSETFSHHVLRQNILTEQMCHTAIPTFYSVTHLYINSIYLRSI